MAWAFNPSDPLEFNTPLLHGQSGVLAPWTRKLTFDLEASVRELVASQNATREAFRELCDFVSLNNSEVRGRVSEADAAIRRMDEATKVLIQPRFFNELHDHTAPKTPHRALEVVEVAETIFLFLSMKDLLSLRKVNRHFYDIVSQRPELQKALFLLPDSEKPFTIPMVSFADFFTEKHRIKPADYPDLLLSQLDSGSDFTLSITQHKVRAKFKCNKGLDKFSVSPLFRRMLVSQPPVKKVVVDSIGCCRFGDRGHHLRSYYNKKATPVVANETGVTIGDIYDAAEAISKEHWLCPLATPEMTDDNGIVHPDVTLSGCIDTSDQQSANTPFVPAPIPPPPPFSIPPDFTTERSAKEQAHFKAYRTAKILAAHNDIEIPSLDEYDKNRIYYESLKRPYWITPIDPDELGRRTPDPFD